MESSRLFEQLNHLFRKIPQQKLSYGSAFVLVVYLAYLLSTVLWQFVAVNNSHGSVSVPELSQTNQSSSNSSFDVSKLVSLNLFGNAEKKAVVKEPVNEAPKTAPKTRLNVTLTGLVADASNPISNSSVAIIESSSGQNTYGVDEKVDGTSASVYQIFIDRVILLVSGRYETLMLEGIEYSTTIPGTDNKVDKSATDIKPKTLEIYQTTDVKKPEITTQEQIDKSDDLELSQALREQREQLFDDPKKLLDVIRIRPYRKDNELKGYHLSPGKDPKLFEQVGLKRNDLATSINGYDLTDMQQALTVMTELKSMTEATITVVRDDTLIDIILAL